MKHRLKDLLVAVPFLVALLISNIGGVLPASLDMPKAAAASNGNFIFYTPNSGSDLSAIKKALADNDENNSTLAKTQIQVKGGVFGNTPVAMNYSADNSGCAQAQLLSASMCGQNFGGQDANLYVYTVQYICEPGKGLVQSAGNNANYTISLAASVDLAGDRGNLIKNNKLNSSVNMHWINFTSVKYVSKNTPGTVQQSKDITKTSDVPNECMPQIARTAFSGEVGETGGHNVNTTIAVKPLSEAPATAGGATAAGGTTGGTNDSPSCESNGSVLGWLLCPLINGVADALNSLYSGLIQPLLRTRPLILTPNSGDPNKTYDVWNNFRIYGNILLVIVLLIVVFGESIGGGLIDAYTARKILPRLLIGAILINLSIYIVAFGMDVANILGNGLQSLIQAPFQAGNDFKLNIFGASPGFSDDALGIVGVIGGLWAVAAVWGPISFLMLFILVPTLIVMALIVGILLIRQGLILLLIFAAPIAFALWCLPNTEQYFKRWWDTLFRTLLIYPIVAVIFAMANVLSVTISNTTSSLKVFSGLLAVICLFAPLYLIPFSFQIAGGIMGTLGNLGKRVSAGGMGWAKGARGNTAKSNIQKMKEGTRYNPNGRVTGGFNKWRNDRIAGVAGGARKGFGFGKSGAEYRSTLRGINENNAAKNAALAARAGDQNALAVLARSGGTGKGGRTAARALQKEQGWSDDETTRAFHAAKDIGFNSGNVGAAMKLHGANPSDKIRANGAVGIQKHIEGLKQSAITANGGDTSAGDRAVFAFNTGAKESGQLDMSAETVDKAWQMSTVGQHVTGKPESLRTFTDHFAEVLANPEQFAPSEVEAAAVGIAEIDAQKSGASDVNRATINEALFDRMGLDDQSPVSIPDQIAGKLAGTSGGRNVPAETIRKRYRAAAAPTMGGGPVSGPSGGGGGQQAPPASGTSTGPSGGGGGGQQAPPSSPPAPGPAGGGGSRVQLMPQTAPPKRNGSQPLYLDVGSKKVRVSEDEYLAARGYDPRVRQGPNGEDAVVTAPVGGMKYQWKTFDTPGGRKSRVLQELDSSGKVVRPNVVLEAAKDSGYNYNYNQATKKTSLVDSGGNVVFDGVPADWVGWQYGESPISRRGAEKLKEASQSNDDTTLTIDHSTGDKKLSSGDLLKGATEAVTESKKKA